MNTTKPHIRGNGRGTKGGLLSRIFGNSEKNFLELLMKSMATPVVVVEPDLTISMVNDAALDIMGYRREEVVGKMTCAQFQKTLLCGTENCTLKNCMRTGEVVVGETIAETRDGKKIPIRAACSQTLLGSSALAAISFFLPSTQAV